MYVVVPQPMRSRTAMGRDLHYQGDERDNCEMGTRSSSGLTNLLVANGNSGYPVWIKLASGCMSVVNQAVQDAIALVTLRSSTLSVGF